MAQFRDFLSEGKMGGVRLAMSPSTVEQLLGPAEDRSVKKRPVEILKFGAVELAFKFIPDTNDSRLVSIALYFNQPNRRMPNAVVFEDWTPTDQTTEADFQKFLDSSGIQSHLKVDGETKYLEIDSGASVVFDDGCLHSIHFHQADKLPARRQMSVSLPEATLSQLRARAEREKVSLKDLIEKVLTTSA